MQLQLSLLFALLSSICVMAHPVRSRGFCLCNRCYPGNLYDGGVPMSSLTRTYRTVEAHTVVPGAYSIFGPDQQHFFLESDPSWTQVPSYPEICRILEVDIKDTYDECGRRVEGQEIPPVAVQLQQLLAAHPELLDQYGIDRDVIEDGMELEGHAAEDEATGGAVGDPVDLAAAEAARAARLQELEAAYPGSPGEGGKLQNISKTSTYLFTAPAGDEGGASELKDTLRHLLLELLILKGEHNLTQRCVEHILDILGHLDEVQEDLKQNIPNNFKAMLTALDRELDVEMPQVVVYHICDTCYHVFRKDTKDDVQCPSGHERYGDDGLPKKKFFYRPLASWLKMVYGNRKAAELMRYHATEEAKLGCPDDEIVDFYSGSCYKEAVKEGSIFHDDSRHAMLGLITDGTLIFKDDRGYSAWPLAVTCYNLPPNLRYKLGATTIIGMIPGKREKHQVFNLQPYLEIVRDDIAVLQEKGVEVVDSFAAEPFTCKAKFVQAISDLRGLEKALEVPPVPALIACIECWLKGYKPTKVIYPGLFRWLPLDHPLRREAEEAQLNCRPGQELKQNDYPPRLRTEEERRARVAQPPVDAEQAPGGEFIGLPDDLYNEAFGIAEPEDDAMQVDEDDQESSEGGEAGGGEESEDSDSDTLASSISGRSSSGSDDEEVLECDEETLPGHSHLPEILDSLTLGIGADGMHTLGGVVKDSFVHSLVGDRHTESVRLYEITDNRRFETNDKPFQFSEVGKVAVESALNTVADFLGSRVAGQSFRKLFKLHKKTKAHDFILLASPFGVYILLHALGVGNLQLKAYAHLLIACSLLWSKSFDRKRLVTTIRVVLVALTEVELYLPHTEMDMKTHLLLHLLRRIIATGPLWVTSMFAYESIWGRLKQWVRNMRHPEANATNTFLQYELGNLAYCANPDAFASRVVKPLIDEEFTPGMDYWLPNQVAEEEDHPVALIGNAKHLKLSTSQIYNLHLYYTTVDAEYKELWEAYEAAYRSDASLRRVPARHVAGGLNMTAWEDAYNHWKDWTPNDRDISPEQRCIMAPITPWAEIYQSFTVKSAVFGPSSYKKGSKRWFVVKKGTFGESDRMVFGEVQTVLVHSRQFLGDLKATVAEVKWYQSVDANREYDKLICVPVLKGRPVRMQAGSMHPLQQVVPMNIAVFDHPREQGKKLALHRDFFFMTAAGYDPPSFFA